MFFFVVLNSEVLFLRQNCTNKMAEGKFFNVGIFFGNKILILIIWRCSRFIVKSRRDL